MVMVKIPKQEVLDILWEDHGGTVYEKRITGTSRWSVHYRLVFKRDSDSKVYETSYSVGATEQQDERPWQYEKVAECHEVKPVLKTITVYEKVSDS